MTMADDCGALWLALLVLTCLTCGADGGLNTHTRLNEFIQHHEPLVYNKQRVISDHQRLKRSLPEEEEYVEIEF